MCITKVRFVDCFPFPRGVVVGDVGGYVVVVDVVVSGCIVVDVVVSGCIVVVSVIVRELVQVEQETLFKQLKNKQKIKNKLNCNSEIWHIPSLTPGVNFLEIALNYCARCPNF